MEKILLLLFAGFVAVLSIVRADVMADPLLLKGRVYCDTCRCGFETSASKHLAGAVVRVECRDRATSRLTYAKDGVTDSSGHYQILVEGDRGDEICDAMLVKSSDPECSTPSKGRDHARVVLTRNGGISSNARFANAMGFVRNTPLANCQQILQQYQDD